MVILIFSNFHIYTYFSCSAALTYGGKLGNFFFLSAAERNMTRQLCC